MPPDLKKVVQLDRDPKDILHADRDELDFRLCHGITAAITCIYDDNPDILLQRDLEIRKRPNPWRLPSTALSDAQDDPEDYDENLSGALDRLVSETNVWPRSGEFPNPGEYEPLRHCDPFRILTAERERSGRSQCWLRSVVDVEYKAVSLEHNLACGKENRWFSERDLLDEDFKLAGSTVAHARQALKTALDHDPSGAAERYSLNHEHASMAPGPPH